LYRLSKNSEHDQDASRQFLQQYFLNDGKHLKKKIYLQHPCWW